MTDTRTGTRTSTDVIGITKVEATIDITPSDRETIAQAAPKLGILFRGSAQYETARKWGVRAATHGYFPSAIAYPTSAEEVAALVRWATGAGISLCLKNGGHSGISFTRNLVISMDRMTSVKVAPYASPPRVTCGGGVRVTNVDAATAAHGLATVLGNCGMVGVVGAMMGGGTGYMARWQGLTIDQLLTATLVLADGSIVEASNESHPDLFYAVRGGYAREGSKPRSARVHPNHPRLCPACRRGANFGIVVSLTLRCFPIGWDSSSPGNQKTKGPGALFGGMRIMFTKRIGLGGNSCGRLGLLRRFRDYAESAPDVVSIELMLPTFLPVAAAMHTYKGPLGEAKAESKKWKKVGKAVMSTMRVKSYFRDIQSFVAKVDGKAQLKGYSERWVTMLTGALPDAALEVIADAAKTAPKGAEAVIMIQRLGGKIESPEGGEDSCAYAHRKAGYWLVLNMKTSKSGKPEEPTKAASAIRWLNATCALLEPHIITRSGVGCIAFVSGEELGDGGVEKPMAPVNVFGDAARLRRLYELKLKYDPKNVFAAVENGISGAHNIDPTNPPPE